MSEIELVRKLRSLGVSEFRGNRIWYSNGTRGHLHASHYCEKLNSTGVVSQDLSFTQVLSGQKKVCVTCQKSIIQTSAEKDLAAGAKFLESVASSVSYMLNKSAGDQFKGYPGLLALRYNTGLRNLREHVKNKGQFTGLETMRDECLALIDNSLLPESPQTVYGESLRYAALSCIKTLLEQSGSSFDSDIWGGRAALSVCGDTEGYNYTKNNPLRNLRELWFSMCDNSATSVESAYSLIAEDDLARLVGAPEKLSLFDFPVDSQPSTGETLSAFATRAWSHKVTSVLSDVASMWADKYETYFNQSKLVAFGVVSSDKVEYGDYRSQHDFNFMGGLPDPVMSAHTIVRHLTASGGFTTTVIVCPEIVARYIENACKIRRRYEMTPVVRDVESLYRDHAETAVALWSPRDNSSVYQTFSVAYKTATAI